MTVPKRAATREKYRAIKKRFDHLYNVKRVRYDDVLHQIAQEFFMHDIAGIQRILALDVLDETAYTKQMKLDI